MTANFVALVADPNKNRSRPEGLHFGTNPHWRPQRYLSNMERWLPYFDFVGAYEHLALHAEMLLRARGLWDAYGAAGWRARASAARPGGGGATARS